MANYGYVASALVTGALVLAVVAALVRVIEWRRYSPALGDGGRTPGGPVVDAAERLAGSPATWSVAFLAVTLGSAAGAVVFVQQGVTETFAAVARAALGSLVAVILGYLVYGVYITARGRGFVRSQSAAMGAWVGGLLLVGAIVADLVLAA